LAVLEQSRRFQNSSRLAPVWAAPEAHHSDPVGHPSITCAPGRRLAVMVAPFPSKMEGKGGHRLDASRVAIGNLWRCKIVQRREVEAGGATPVRR
jgi:hypothetical protein